MTLLEVKDLNVTYRTGRSQIHAVQGISFAVSEGGSLGLAGESGSGKSTVALSLLRLLPLNAIVTGQILLNGEDILAAGWSRMRQVRWAEISLIFQSAMSALHPVQKIGKQIIEPILLHEKVSEKQARTRALELLESVRVPVSAYDRYPHEFSGGQRQRIMIAMALACNPKIIIADEATTALDIIVQAQILDLLKSLASEHGIGLIMISHDLYALTTVCDNMAVMYAGRFVEYGPSHQLMEHPQHPYTRALSAAFPEIGNSSSRFAPSGLAGDPPDATKKVLGCSFSPRCPVVMSECSSAEIRLWPSGDGRQSACLRVLL